MLGDAASETAAKAEVKVALVQADDSESSQGQAQANSRN
jgi:hypothetical protein